MSLHFAARSRASQPPRERAGELPLDHDGPAECYLTDGVELYRSIGVMSLDAERMIALEDCRSLDIVLMTLEDFRRRGLRPVRRSERARPAFW